MHYTLPIPRGVIGQHTKRWLILAIWTLAVGGLFSLPPLLLRKPEFHALLPIDDLFATTLVIHVNLTILFWFLSIFGVLTSIYIASRTIRPILFVADTAFWVSAFGAIVMVASAFFPDPGPLKNNYIPMLQNFPFALGLSFFGCGILLQTFLTAAATGTNLDFNEEEKTLYMGILTTALITFVAFFHFFMSARLIPEKHIDQGGLEYYEQLFWAGGHILQFTFTQLVKTIWIWLAGLCAIPVLLSPKWIRILFYFNALLVIPTGIIYRLYPIYSPEFFQFFTDHMRYASGITPTIVGVAILIGIVQKWLTTPAKRKQKSYQYSHAMFASLVLSILLFAYGGILGLVISGANVTIPAHYHGSIIGISIAFIGFVFFLLPMVGYGETKGKLSAVQPYFLGVGQAMHISGLAIMGGYGALRKTAGESLAPEAAFGKFLFISGGSLAVLGGLIFIIVAFKSLLYRKK